MKAVAKSLGRTMLKWTGLYGAFSLMRRGPLRDDGWFRSFREGRSVDASGRPIPWFTYPAIEFLATRVTSRMRVFEYGCGASTRWWAERVHEVVSVEHDRSWYEQVAADLPANVTLRHVELVYGGDYAATARHSPGRFDIVVIDGRDRVSCARAALVALTEDGVIVWDNSDRPDYQEGYALLEREGFRKLPFVGLTPIFSEKSETGVFYRAANCLGL